MSGGAKLDTPYNEVLCSIFNYICISKQLVEINECWVGEIFTLNNWIHGKYYVNTTD